MTQHGQSDPFTRVLTARLWLATHGDWPLNLPRGRYATDGWKLWKLDGEEEAKSKETRSEATTGAHRSTGDPGTEAEHSKRARLHRRGDGGDEGTGECDHGVRELRGAVDRRGASRERSEHRVQVPELRRVQRDAGLEPLLELVEDFEDRRANQGQRLQHVHSIAQGWEAGDFALHIHLTLGPEDGKEGRTQEWCADVQRAPAFDEDLVSGEGPIRDDPKVRLVEADDGGYEYPMLVRVRKISEPPDRFRLLAGLVRLVVADDCPVLARDAWEASAELVTERLVGSRHWELHTFRVFGSGVPADLDQAPGQVVERGPEVLDGVAQRQAVVGPNVGKLCHADYGDVPVWGFDVDLEGNGVSVRVGAFFERRCYALHVLARPAELLPGAPDRIDCHALLLEDDAAQAEGHTPHGEDREGV